MNENNTDRNNRSPDTSKANNDNIIDALTEFFNEHLRVICEEDARLRFIREHVGDEDVDVNFSLGQLAASKAMLNDLSAFLQFHSFDEAAAPEGGLTVEALFTPIPDDNIDM